MILEKWIQESSLRSMPLQVAVELTYRCNLRCRHCYIDSHQDNGRILNVSQWENIFKQLRKAGALYLNLLGGEPLLYPELITVCRKASSLGFFVTLTTNGLLLDQHLLEQLIQAGLSGIAFSLYSLDASIHEGIIGTSGVHKDLIRTIELAKSKIKNISINCLLMRDNIEGVIEMMEWATKRKIGFRFDPQVTTTFSGDRTPIAFVATQGQLASFYSQLKKRWPSAELGVKKRSDQGHICNVARGKCSIDPYGNLMGCVEMRNILGNLLETSFAAIWQSPAANRLRSLKNANLEEKAFFALHCPAIALKETGSPFKLTQRNKQLAQIWKG